MCVCVSVFGGPPQKKHTHKQTNWWFSSWFPFKHHRKGIPSKRDRPIFNVWRFPLVDCSETALTWIPGARDPGKNRPGRPKLLQKGGVPERDLSPPRAHVDLPVALGTVHQRSPIIVRQIKDMEELIGNSCPLLNKLLVWFSFEGSPNYWKGLGQRLNQKATIFQGSICDCGSFFGILVSDEEWKTWRTDRSKQTAEQTST